MERNDHKYRKAVLLCLLVLSGFQSIGQSSTHEPSRKARKLYNQAIEAYMGRESEEALVLVTQSLKSDAHYFEAWMLQSQLLESLQRWKDSMRSMERALELRPDVFPKWGQKLMHIQHRSESYAAAHESLLRALKVCDTTNVNWSLLAASVRFAAEAVTQPRHLNAVPISGNVNTGAAEYYPTLFVSGNRMIFTRQVGGNGLFQGQEDFFEASRENLDASWSEIGPVRGVNTLANEGAPSVRGDGRSLIFTACEQSDGGYGTRRGKGSCDLFQTEWNVSKGEFKEAVNLDVLNSNAWESQPSLSSDGRVLMFVRAQRLKEGGVKQDIYKSIRLESGDWGPPRCLNDLVNTKGREENPVLHPDGQTLYFASDGHPGMGGMDIFISRQTEDGEWGEPENLGYPINTGADENSLQVFPDGRMALFATDRVEQGNLDLWQFTLPLEAQAESVGHFSGRVFDAQSGAPVSAVVQVYDVEGGLLLAQKSDADDGTFILPIKPHTPLTFTVDHPEYAFFNQHFSKERFVEDTLIIGLTRLEIGTVMTLKSVRFETNSALLDRVFQPELDQLVRLMHENVTLRIRVIGHTDNAGSSEFNLRLSAERSLAVSVYLQENGISKNRIEEQGRGSSEPVASNESEEGRSQNRRTEIVIID